MEMPSSALMLDRETKASERPGDHTAQLAQSSHQRSHASVHFPQSVDHRSTVQFEFTEQHVPPEVSKKTLKAESWKS